MTPDESDVIQQTAQKFPEKNRLMEYLPRESIISLTLYMYKQNHNTVKWFNIITTNDDHIMLT